MASSEVQAIRAMLNEVTQNELIDIIITGKVPDHLSDSPVLSHWNKCGSDPDRDLFTDASDRVNSECADNALQKMEIENPVCENNSLRKSRKGMGSAKTQPSAELSTPNKGASFSEIVKKTSTDESIVHRQHKTKGNHIPTQTIDGAGPHSSNSRNALPLSCEVENMPTEKAKHKYNGITRPEMSTAVNRAMNSIRHSTQEATKKMCNRNQ
ncbi:hypothetical protein JTB14_029653 [Gonioctena quinquepunctata]|nr:hypothetical protein JTB14_029653 [Gonioctena quinquepunctata]